MNTSELEKLPSKGGEIAKGESHIVVELIEYEQDSVIKKSILKKATGSINAVSFESGQGLNESVSSFDTYLQVIDGTVLIDIDGKTSMLSTGDGILIPAHKSSNIKPNGRFKLLLTVIKSGYE
jgi:quercetin dioxygenase-like cupin family protein